MVRQERRCLDRPGNWLVTLRAFQLRTGYDHTLSANTLDIIIRTFERLCVQQKCRVPGLSVHFSRAYCITVSA